MFSQYFRYFIESTNQTCSIKTDLKPATLFKKRLWHRFFLVNFAKFLTTLSYRTPLSDCFELYMFYVLRDMGRQSSQNLLFRLWFHSSRTSRQEVLYKKGLLKNFTKFKGKHPCQSLFLIKLLASNCNFIKKETLAQVLSCEFCEISKNIFREHFLLCLSFKNKLTNVYGSVLLFLIQFRETRIYFLHYTLFF